MILKANKVQKVTLTNKRQMQTTTVVQLRSISAYYAHKDLKGQIPWLYHPKMKHFAVWHREQMLFYEHTNYANKEENKALCQGESGHRRC